MKDFCSDSNYRQGYSKALVDIVDFSDKHSDILKYGYRNKKL